MAFTAMTYAHGETVVNIYNEIEEGSILYNDDGYETQRTITTIHFSLNVNSDFETKVLYTYADGKQVRIHYHIYEEAESHLYVMKHYYDLVDAQGNLVEIPNTVAHNNPTSTYTDSQPWDPTQPGFDVFPFSDCVYIPTAVNYFVSGTETLVGDEALTVNPTGDVYWKKSRPPIGGYDEISGTQSLGTIRDSWGSRSANIAMLTDDTMYGLYYGAVDPYNQWHGAGDIPIPPEPSEPGGGDRPSEDGGVAIDFPGLPGTSVINTGLISLYNPDVTKLRDLAGVLWGNDFEQSIKKVLNDPFDGLIGLSMIPFSPTTAGSISVDIGNFDTEVSMPIVGAQYYTLDCGTLQIKENWKNALDYNSTTCEIFVPFVGFRPLDIQDVMGRTLALKYNVDILTGAAIAILKCGDKCLYEWPCNLAYNIPLTGSNKAALYTGLISVAMSGLGGLAAGGAMGAVGGAATSAINVATHAQSNVQRSGSLASNTGILGEFQPYIVLHRPKQSLAQNFKTFKGYQSNITSLLGNCQGYTEVDYINLSVAGATDTELDEIETLLKGGVII